MVDLLHTTLEIAGAVALLAVVVALGVVLLRRLLAQRVPRRTVVELDLRTPLVEAPPREPVLRLARRRGLLLHELVDGLDRASRDKRVAGLIVRIGRAPGGLAQAEELYDAVSRFRETGRPAVAFAETFSAESEARRSYLVALACGRIVLQPSGELGLTGVLGEAYFLKPLLERLGLRARLDHREDFKTAMNVLTEEGFTEPHRESLRHLVEEQLEVLVGAMAARRGLATETARKLVEGGPYTAPEARELGLVDGLAYADEVYDRARADAGKRAKVLRLDRYLARRRERRRRSATVALVHGVGAVVSGRSGRHPVMGATMGSDSVCKALRAAARDRSVKAIIFRVDSRGGSYVASDTIWREIRCCRERGKPVVACMGNVAGSGGYFVAMAADRVIARPGTITGSIGVVAGKVLTTDLWSKIGIRFDDLRTADSATYFSSRHDYTPEQWEHFQAWLDATYDDFLSKVSSSRSLERERVCEVAKGRIWSGSDALDHGLVDALGGLPEAVAAARELAAIPDKRRVRLRVFPEAPSWLGVLLGEDGGDEDEPRGGKKRSEDEREDPATTLLRAAAVLGLEGEHLAPPAGALTMPWLPPLL